MTAESAGYQVSFIEYPWSRVVASTKNGAITGSYCFSYTKKRTEWINFLDQTFLISGISFYKKVEKTVTYKSPEQLLNLQIAVTKNSYEATKLRELGAKNLTYVHNDSTLCRLLLGNRIDLVISRESDFGGMSCTSFQDESIPVETIGPPFALDYQGLGISKALPNHLEIVRNLNQSFYQLVKQGKAQKIYQAFSAEIPQEVKNLISN